MTEEKRGKMKKGKFVEVQKTRFTLRNRQNGSDYDSSEEDDEEEEEEEKSERSEEELELPEKIGTVLNLSKRNLKKIPEDSLEKMHEVQYLYLEGNKLAELPQNFFQSLCLLKWLDLRNNSLITLPTNGLQNHPCLEVILLQGNQIRNLPVELATIPSLKGLQTTGNPITNVPYEVIVEGFHAVIQHLEKLRAQEEILLPVSNTFLVKPSTSQDSFGMAPPERDELTESELRTWDMEKFSQWRHFMKKKSDSPKPSNFWQCETKKVERPMSQQPKISVSVRSHPKLPVKPQPFRCGAYNKSRRRSVVSARRHLRMKNTALGYKRKPITAEMIQEKAMKEAYRNQVRETLEKQAKKIQRMRDKEILKSWRDHSRITRQQMKLLDNYQQYPSKDFAEKTPFDVDPEFLNMLNRVDLYRSLKDYDNRSKRKKKPRVKLTALDLERQMCEIMRKLQELNTEEVGENSSPTAKHNHMCSKINKIMDIQKTLKNLQKLNSTMSGVSTVIKKKPKE